MHTSAHTTTTAQMLQWSGTLAQPAEARTAVNAAGMSVPMLCLLLELDNCAHNTLCVEQPFAADHFKECEAAARRLKRGMRVTVHTPLESVRLLARGATHIHVLADSTEPTTPPTHPQPEETPQPCLL